MDSDIDDDIIEFLTNEVNMEIDSAIISQINMIAGTRPTSTQIARSLFSVAELTGGSDSVAYYQQHRDEKKVDWKTNGF